MDQAIFNAKNPWREGITPGVPAIERSLLKPMLKTLDDSLVTILLGARATGKTTLLLHLIREAVTRGLALPENVYYFDLDTMNCSDVLESNRSLIDYIGLSPGTNSPRTIVVIDEVQRLDNPGLFLKSVHDLGLPIKLFATGSSSLEIRSQIRESLAGRRITFFLGPLSPRELIGSGGESPEWSIDEYMRWGGYPAVALERDQARKGALLTELLRAYLDRDVEGFLKVERLDAFENMCRLLAHQVGQLVNLNELAGTLKISRDTADRYLTFLRETFIVHVVPPFFHNLRSELTKMPKVYFADLGLRNLLAGELRAAPANAGALAENYVFTLLHSMVGIERIRFWRTQGKAEVDFVVETPDGPLPVEVKSGPLGRLTVPTGLRSFIKTYSPRQALVLNANSEGAIHVNDTELRFVPRDKWVDVLVRALPAEG
jgi:predicted AAA+ superfamily ATPase